ncbi:MAG: porin [Pseudomonadota bacterium]
MSDMLDKVVLAATALAATTTVATADELSILKARLAALQSQLDTIHTTTAITSPDLRHVRGHGGNTWGLSAVRDAANVGDAGGFTIAITPTADLPAPVAEVTVYGYAAGHIAYDFDQNHGTASSFKANTLSTGNAADNGDHVSLTHRRSRVGIKSKIKTGIGRVRTRLEIDANADAEGNTDTGSTNIRLRHAVGHWDMTSDWTLSVGQWWFTAALLPISVSTVDAAGALLTHSRRPQVRLSYSDGPLSWAVAIESPSFESETNLPNIATYIQYDIAGGHELIVTAEVADFEPAGNDEIGWAIQVGTNVNIADIATLTAGFGYGEGLLTRKFVFEESFDNVDADGDPLEALAFLVGLSFALSETTDFNTQLSYVEALADQNGNEEEQVYKLHANIMWRPVKQIRMGWEVVWARKQLEDGQDEDGLRASFATWFFF